MPVNVSPLLAALGQVRLAFEETVKMVEAGAQRISTAAATAQASATEVSRVGGEAVASAQAVASGVAAAMGEATAAVQQGRGSITQASQEVEAVARESGGRVRELMGAQELDAQERIAKLQSIFQDAADAGNVWALMMVGLLDQVADGQGTIDELINTFGDATFKGESVKKLLQEIGPSAGEVQNSLQAMQEQIDGLGIDELTEKLEGHYSGLLTYLNQIIKAWQEGKATADQVLKVIDQIKKTGEFVGTGTEAVINEIEEAVRSGRG